MTDRLLVTGALGFTGTHFSAAARGRGYSVHALQSDLCDRSALAAELSTCGSFDYVVHLAAISAVTHANELAFYEVNLFGTLNFLEALTSLQERPRKVLIASSANVYGNSRQSPIGEGAPPAPVNHYAMSKLAMEHMSARFAGQLPMLVARPFNYTGPGHDERFVIPKLVRHYRERRTSVELGNLDVEREFNDVRSVCQAYLALLALGAEGEVYNICSGRAHSLAEVMETLEGLTGHRLEAKVNPALVRSNEVRRLCGNPAKLEQCIGKMEHPPLSATLQWMLDEDGT